MWQFLMAELAVANETPAHSNIRHDQAGMGRGGKTWGLKS